MYVVCTELATTLCCRGGEVIDPVIEMIIKRELEKFRVKFECRDENLRAEFEAEKLKFERRDENLRAEFEAEKLKVVEVKARLEEVAETVSGWVNEWHGEQ